MNEKLQIVFGMLGGLAIFFVWYEYDERMSAEGRRENEDDSCITHKESDPWCFGRCAYNSSASEQ